MIDIDRLAEHAIPSGSSSPAGTPSSSAALAATDPAEDPYDYGADATPDDGAIAKAFADLDRLTLAAERLTEQRKKAEEHAQKLKTAEEQLLNKEIPELLAKMRLEDCTTASGIQVKVKREIKASLPGHERVEARMAAFRWLIDHGHSGVIKNSIAIVLDRGEDARADDLVVKLRAEGLEVEAKKDVHNQTLGALVREVMTEGTVIPPGTFNIFDMRLAKLSRK